MCKKLKLSTFPCNIRKDFTKCDARGDGEGLGRGGDPLQSFKVRMFIWSFEILIFQNLKAITSKPYTFAPNAPKKG